MFSKWVRLLVVISLSVFLGGCISLFSVKKEPQPGDKIRTKVGLLGFGQSEPALLSLFQTKDTDAVQLLPLYQYDQPDGSARKDMLRMIAEVKELQKLIGDSGNAESLDKELEGYEDLINKINKQ